MSCFVMNPEPLAAIANAVETRLNVGYDYWGFEAPDSLYRELAGCKMSCTYFAEEIYKKLYAVNVRAYNGRYASHEEPADEEAPIIDGSKYIVHHGPEYQSRGEGNGTTYAVLPWHYQLAQLLDCWLYQTAEDATRSDPFRLAMQEFRDGLYSFIVQHSHEYFAGRWGELPRPTPEKKRSGAAIFHINTAPGEAVAQKGHASYPEDFPHLKPGETFTAWRVEDGWEIETTLDSTALMERLERFYMEEAEHDGV